MIFVKHIQENCMRMEKSKKVSKKKALPEGKAALIKYHYH